MKFIKLTTFDNAPLILNINLISSFHPVLSSDEIAIEHDVKTIVNTHESATRAYGVLESADEIETLLSSFIVNRLH